MKSAALLVLLAACWRGEPAAPPSTPVSAGKRPVRPPPRDPPPLDLTDPVVLAKTLRNEPYRALADDGPIVVVDFDAGTIDTMCGGTAMDAQAAWHGQLTDASRPSPRCLASGYTLQCTQVGPPRLSIEFVTGPTFRPRLVTLGDPASSTARITWPGLRQALANPQCP